MESRPGGADGKHPARLAHFYMDSYGPVLSYWGLGAIHTHLAVGCVGTNKESLGLQNDRLGPGQVAQLDTVLSQYTRLLVQSQVRAHQESNNKCIKNKWNDKLISLSPFL